MVAKPEIQNREKGLTAVVGTLPDSGIKVRQVSTQTFVLIIPLSH